MSNHTNHKITIFSKTADVAVCAIITEDAVTPTEQELADARRIVACWNACEGIATEELERGIQVQSQLLAALEEMESAYGELHEGLADMVGDSDENPALTEQDIPDDYQWLMATLDHLCDVRARAMKAIQAAKGEKS